MLAEPGRTDYDINFEFMGFPVRVSIGFWIMGVVLGYGSGSGNDRGMMLLIWIAVLFVSILIHELGHALAFRRFGIHSSIVLYHFGGLAIPGGSFRGSSYGGNLNPYEKMIVSFAGPAFQLVLAAMVLVFVKLNNYALPYFLDWMPGFDTGIPIESPRLRAFVSCALFINVFWSLLNLLPIWPLDGGQIMREVVQLVGGTLYHSSVISIGCCLVTGVLAYQTGYRSPFAFLFLASFAYTNYQIMNNDFGSRW